MSSVSYFNKAKNFVANSPTFNTYVLGMDALQFLYEHSVPGALHDSEERFPPPRCHEGTREVVVVRIADWYGYHTPGKPIMWVHAPVGYGKTAIAGTISKKLEETEGLDFTPLGATFFFSRISPERNNPTRFIVTIAYQLAMSIPELAPHVESAIKRNPMILRKALEVQLVKLIVEPFKAIDGLEDIPNRLVIIDGLDECIESGQQSLVEKKYAEEREKVQIRVLDLIHTLQSHRFPLSFLLLSRPEAWIKQHIESRLFTNSVEVVDLYAVGDHMNDVEKYVRAELARIAGNIGDEEWPTEGIVQCFINKTNGHLLYASTVIRHIEDPYDDPRKRLNDIFDASIDSSPDHAHSTPFSSLYELYRQILRSCPKSNHSLMAEVLEDIFVLSWLFQKSSGLLPALAILDSLSGRAAGCGSRAIRGLHAVLRIVPSPKTPQSLWSSLDPFIHYSFAEFLMSPMLSLEFAVDSTKGRRRFVWNCLDCMPPITSPSRPLTEGGHIQFACLAFWPLWAMAWSSEEDVRRDQDNYIKVVKKLLTIDLTTCFVLLLSSFQDCLEFPPHLFVHLFHGFFFNSLEHLFIMESDFSPVAQQAIIHVSSSIDGAMGRVPTNGGGSGQSPRLSYIFIAKSQMRNFMKWLCLRLTNSNRRKSDEVVQALEYFRGVLESWDYAVSPALGWSSYVRPILDHIRLDNRTHISE